MRSLMLVLLFLPACITILDTEYFQKPNGEIVSCYPNPNERVDMGIIGGAAEISALTSDDRELREKTSKDIERREEANNDYNHCLENAELNGWHRMTSEEIEAKRKANSAFRR